MEKQGQANRGEWFKVGLLVVAAMVMTEVGQAAWVHQASLPPFPYLNKNKPTTFAYLEAESALGASTYSDVRDNGRTFFDTGWYVGATLQAAQTGSDGWYPSDQSRIVAYGNPNTGFNGANPVNVYWENLSSLNLNLGTYEVWVYTWPGYYGATYGGHVDYNFYGGLDKTTVDAATSIGTLTVPESATDRGWYLVGYLPITSGMDTFRLKLESYSSTVTFDAVMLVVPEPSTMLLLGLGGLLVCRRSKK